MAQFELTPLSQRQVASFTSRWLESEDGDRLLVRIAKSPYSETGIRPLTLAHLCAIYESTGRIPDNQKQSTERSLICSWRKWDEQRSVKRESACANFEWIAKASSLNLAYVLTMSVKRSAYGKDDLVSAHKRIYDNFGLLGEPDQLKFGRRKHVP